MNSTLSNIAIFAAGAAIGSVVTWKLLKTKYEQIADEEIESVKEVYAKKEAEKKAEAEPKESDEDSIVTIKNEKPDIFEYAKKYKEIAEENEYITAEGGVMEMDKPFVIEPEEYDEYGYDTVSLSYYADGVLTDDMDNPIEDVEGMVGRESLTHFGEFEDDSVFVRNHALKTDFEILLDTRNFSDITSTPEVESE
jgi:hypothetical protein